MLFEKQSGGPWIGLQSESKGSVLGDMIMWGHCKIFGFYSELGRLRIPLVPVLTADCRWTWQKKGDPLGSFATMWTK